MKEENIQHIPYQPNLSPISGDGSSIPIEMADLPPVQEELNYVFYRHGNNDFVVASLPETQTNGLPFSQKPMFRKAKIVLFYLFVVVFFVFSFFRFFYYLLAWRKFIYPVESLLNLGVSLLGCFVLYHTFKGSSLAQTAFFLDLLLYGLLLCSIMSQLELLLSGVYGLHFIFRRTACLLLGLALTEGHKREITEIKAQNQGKLKRIEALKM